MALYFKASYGLHLYNQRSALNFNPENDIILTDINRYYVLPTNPKGEFSINGDTGGPSHFIDESVNEFGDQFYKMVLLQNGNFYRPVGTTVVPYRYGVLREAHSWFPSAPYWAPNLARYYDADYNTAIGIIKFSDDVYVNCNGIFYKTGGYWAFLSYPGAMGWCDQSVTIPFIRNYNASTFDYRTAVFGRLYCVTNTTWNDRDANISYNDSNTTRLWKEILRRVSPVYTPDSDDPYEPGGNNEPSGGEGSFDNTTNPILYDLPTCSADLHGYANVYQLSDASARSLSSYLWSTSFTDNLIKLYSNPAETILAIGFLHTSLHGNSTDLANYRESSTIKLGNIDTQIASSKYTIGSYIIDCGSINIDNYSDSFLDYHGYTSASLYIPFVGYREIDINLIMGKTISIQYYLALPFVCSGVCNVYADSSLIYSYNCSLFTKFPISGTSTNNFLQTIFSVLGMGASAAVGGYSFLGIPAMANSAMNGLRLNNYSRSNMGTAFGLMSYKNPYFIIQRPIQALPYKYNSINGLPSYITRQLKQVSGYTKVYQLRTHNLSATQEEIDEIIRLLKEGVYV